MARGFSYVGLELPCKRLGKSSEIETLKLRVDEYFISTISSDIQAGVNAELAAMREKCIKRASSLLYRCPKDCPSVDFFLVKAFGQVFAIQVSIKALLDHSTVESIVGIREQFGVDSINRYIYITVNPETDENRKKDTLTMLEDVRIVSAEDWIGV